jgi:hypothetical protein
MHWNLGAEAERNSSQREKEIDVIRVVLEVERSCKLPVKSSTTRGKSGFV